MADEPADDDFAASSTERQEIQLAALASRLRAALASRAVIDQALGVIMAQQQCAPAQAFAILRTASQNGSSSLREAAAQIVTSVGSAPPRPPAGQA
jgi:AmiR/NasT family two-component response regulator